MKQMLAVLILMLAPSVSVAAAGFDCAKASTVDEHIVCDIPQLSQLDSLLQPAYLEAKAASPDENVPRMARDFLVDRHACGDDQACLLSTYLGALDGFNDLGATVEFPTDITAETISNGRAKASEAVPEKVGQCVLTQVLEVHPRIGDDFAAGTGVDFSNEGYQVSYDREEALIASRPKDEVVMCLISVPHHCPDGDDRGGFT
ncbi:lysozyme inhibitor LprI family protein [Pararhizobium sp. PWRC1-1]|uniref:lysozyme inhibitor LprI family protein n=1 Tax=Pararhizobium sp. PWRC1-1 TaxID=2804566 RepID=UPI003CF22EB9